jgi:hypothetical protein
VPVPGRPTVGVRPGAAACLALIGPILVAAVMFLPGLMAGIGAVLPTAVPDMEVDNLLGGCVFNLMTSCHMLHRHAAGRPSREGMLVRGMEWQ